MKVKYWKSAGILSCNNVDFELHLKVHLLKSGSNSSVLYDPIRISNFIDSSFLPSQTVNCKFDHER